MGASDSKLVFKQGIFRLSEQKDIRADDPYWTGFWELPESAEDVFSLFSPADIRRTRDNNLENLETLILAVTSRLCILRNHPSFPDPELAPERDALNCIRVLTRLLPFIYESDHLDAWEDQFFWGARRKRSRRGQLVRSEVIFDEADPEQTPADGEPEFEKAKPLAEELIDALIDLLFFSDFTLPKAPAGKSKVTYAIWQSGVGCNTPVSSTKEFENNRTEILRLLLALASKSMYMSANVLPVKGVKAITYITTCPDKQVVLSVLCSMLNTTLKYNPASWRVPYDHVVFKDPKQILVTYCLQLLLVLILYPIPEPGNGPPPKNYFRHFLGRLHRPQDFQFLVDGMTRILNQPLQATSSYLPGSHKSLTWAPEMIMLFWEALQCNKRFRSFIIDTDRAHDFVVLVLFYAIDQRNDPTKQGLIRMCIFVLQTLSVEPNFGKSLNKTFERQESLPASIRIQNFHGTYADYLITSIFTLLTTSKGKLDAIYPALLAIINNIAAHIENLGRATSSKLLQLFASMSSPSFLFANEGNHVLLQSLLEALNAIVEHQYCKNPNLVFSIIRSKKRFQALRDFTLESGQEEIERQNQLRKEQGSDAGTGRRADSIDSLRSPISSRAPTLRNVPEDNSAFAIGDDEDSEDEGAHGPAHPRSPVQPQSGTNSRTASISSSVDDAVPLQLRGMSEKARGKMPVGQPSFSRQNSTTSLNSVSTPTLGSNEFFAPSSEWIESWLPELPLHTILTLISQLAPMIPTSGSSSDTTAALAAIRQIEVRGIEPSPIRVHLFEWSPLSLGWYESLLWSFVFAGEMLVSKGTAGVWNGTSIRLFKVQETAAQTPSLLAPRGAVDAVGSNLVQRIGSLNIRGGTTQAGQRGSSNGGNNGPTTMAKIMANIAVDEDPEHDSIQPYGMRVSSRYLDLTRRKLELTRLPRELQLPDSRRWEYGTPKAVLEPLIDFWLEQYDWRTQEALFNNALPQFRTTIRIPSHSPLAGSELTGTQPAHPPLRVHFVHKRSKHRNAIPLLFCHSWPSSFVELYKVVDALTDPVSLPSYGIGAQQAFHVVAPSIPGFGFSDASPVEGFGLRETAGAFDEVMGRLGYAKGGYVAHGAGWGFKICRALALYYPQHCLAVHTTNPSLLQPTMRRNPMVYLKYQIASFTHAKFSYLNFGYVPADFAPAPQTLKNTQSNELGASGGGFDASDAALASQYSQRPQTVSYSLCDSPIGLLACMLDALHSRSAGSTSSHSQSPFLSLSELSQKESQQASRKASQQPATVDDEVELQIQPAPPAQIVLSPRYSETNGQDYTWAPTEILSWTMMQWLPGPEAGLRWLKQASHDSSPANPAFWETYSTVPLGISQFRPTRGSTESPLMWAEAVQNLAWAKRHQRSARWPAWEAPDLLVLDLRECFGGWVESRVVRIARDDAEDN